LQLPEVVATKKYELACENNRPTLYSSLFSDFLFLFFQSFAGVANKNKNKIYKL